MNVLVLAVLLAAMQSPPVPRKTPNQPASDSQNVKGNPNNEQTATEVSGPRPGISEGNQREGQTQASHSAREIIREPAPVSHKDGWDKAYVTFTGLLVAVGGFGVAYAVKTLRAIKRQADLMEKQTGILEKSVVAAEANAEAARQGAETAKESAKTQRIGARAALRQMEIAAKTHEVSKASLEAATKSADAAKDNAEAAKMSVEALIAKERARIRFEIGELKLYPPDAVGGISEVGYRIFCIGQTPAFILESRATVKITDSENPENTGMSLPANLPPVIHPNVEGIEKRAYIFQDVDKEMIDRQKQVIHFYGIIEYTDVFEMRRSTKFRYLWRVRDDPFYGGPRGHWIKHGSEEDNKAT
jgi:hypothetical protein